MSKKNKILCLIYVLGALIQNYLAQISHVPADQIAKWTLHDWTGAGLFVVLSGLTAWKTFITNPDEKPQVTVTSNGNPL